MSESITLSLPARTHTTTQPKPSKRKSLKDFDLSTPRSESESSSPSDFPKPKQIKVNALAKGSMGQATADTIAVSLESYNAKNQKQLGLSFDGEVFTISNSSAINEKTMTELIQCNNTGWYPFIQGKNESGNYIIGLSGLPPKLIGISDKTLGYSTDSPSSMEVAQGELAIAKASEKITHLQTFGMGPCVGCALYDSESKTGVLTHIDMSMKVRDLEKIINKLKNQGIKPENLSATIHGGDETIGSNEIFTGIQDLLQKNKIKIVSATQGDGSTASSLQLDLNTGETSTYSENIPYQNDRKNTDAFLIRSQQSIRSSRLNVRDCRSESK